MDLMEQEIFDQEGTIWSLAELEQRVQWKRYRWMNDWPQEQRSIFKIATTSAVFLAYILHQRRKVQLRAH